MLQLYRWCRKNLGLRIQHDQSGAYKTVDRIGGTGPTAWRQVGVTVPVRAAGSTRIRLSFLADTWMIDWVGVSFEGGTPTETTTLSPTDVQPASKAAMTALQTRLRARDQHYLPVYPGEAYRATFIVEPVPAATRRTYFVRSRGYLVKWLRPNGLDGQEASSQDFNLNDDAVLRGARRWLAMKKDLEQALVAQRSVPSMD